MFSRIRRWGTRCWKRWRPRTWTLWPTVLSWLLVAASLWWIFAWILVGRWLWWRSLDSSPNEIPDLLKLSFAFVAGVGATVGLVVAYRRQRDQEEARHQEQFATAVALLAQYLPRRKLVGLDRLLAVSRRWPATRQQCAGALCRYLRISDSADQGQEEPNLQEVRRAIGETIAVNLRPERETSNGQGRWSDLRFDFYRADLWDADFSRAVFNGEVSFRETAFHGAMTSLANAEFKERVSFEGATFTDDAREFGDVITWAIFEGGYVAPDGTSVDRRTE